MNLKIKETTYRTSLIKRSKKSDIIQIKNGNGEWYHKIVGVTDGGMIMYPDLEENDLPWLKRALIGCHLSYIYPFFDLKWGKPKRVDLNIKWKINRIEYSRKRMLKA